MTLIVEFANPKPAFFPNHNPEKLKHKHHVFDGRIRESGLYICDFSSKHCIGSDIIQQVVRPCRTLSTGVLEASLVVQQFDAVISRHGIIAQRPSHRSNFNSDHLTVWLPSLYKGGINKPGLRASLHTAHLQAAGELNRACGCWMV